MKMKVCQDIWDKFMDQNYYYFWPICRNPITGEWPDPNDEILGLNGLINIRKTNYIEIPDEWVLPVVRHDLPPKTNQKIQRYILSEEGFVANRERLKKGFKYKKSSFEEYEKSIINNARHYKKTLARRVAKNINENNFNK